MSLTARVLRMTAGRTPQELEPLIDQPVMECPRCAAPVKLYLIGSEHYPVVVDPEMRIVLTATGEPVGGYLPHDDVRCAILELARRA